MKHSTSLRKTSEIFEQLKKNIEPKEKHRLLYFKLPKAFEECSLKERQVLMGWHFHTIMMAAISNGETMALRGLASFLKDYKIRHEKDGSSDPWAELGIDEEQRFNLYRSGIIGWFHFQHMRDGLLSLFQLPHVDLNHTIA